MDEESLEYYDDPVSYAPCPCHTQQVLVNELGEWLVCQNRKCNRKIQLAAQGGVPHKQKAGA